LQPNGSVPEGARQIQPDELFAIIGELTLQVRLLNQMVGKLQNENKELQARGGGMGEAQQTSPESRTMYRT
jgi:hypothetical protein